jgi:hypothetical protein
VFQNNCYWELLCTPSSNPSGSGIKLYRKNKDGMTSVEHVDNIGELISYSTTLTEVPSVIGVRTLLRVDMIYNSVAIKYY